MLFLIAAFVLGALMYRSSLRRLERASGTASHEAVRAYVDGKPVDSYVKE